MNFLKPKKTDNINDDLKNQKRVSTASTIQSLPKRRVYVNIPLPPTELDQNGEPRENYVANKIRTSKYTFLTFLPKNLLEQFRRVANMYFLFLVILQLFPAVGGNVQPFMAASPLLSIITMTAIKDAFEDWKRHSQDKSLNRSKTAKLSNWKNVNISDGRSNSSFVKGVWSKIMGDTNVRQGDGSQAPFLNNNNNNNSSAGVARWEECHWQDVQVGDIVYLKNNESVPADTIILSTSEPDGLCYVETKELDGETNLKVRHGVSVTSFMTTESDCERSQFYLESEQPHPNLYSYTGALHWSSKNKSNNHNNGDDINNMNDNDVTDEQQQPSPEIMMNSEDDDNNQIVPVSINDVLLRGCVLRNTEWAIGLVVYTGTDTKIMLNSGDTPSKRSRIEIETNFHVRN